MEAKKVYPARIRTSGLPARSPLNTPTLTVSLSKSDLHVSLSTKHGKEAVRAHNEVQLSNSKHGERIRHKQYSECVSEVDQEIRQIWATSQAKSPDGDLYPVTLSHDLRGRDGFRAALGCHDSP